MSSTEEGHICRPPLVVRTREVCFFWNFHDIVRRGRGPPAGEEQRRHADDESSHQMGRVAAGRVVCCGR